MKNRKPTKVARASSDNPMHRLQREWRRIVLVGIFMLLGGFWVLCHGRPQCHELQWILQTLLITVYVMGLLRKGLPLNHHPQQQVLHANLGYGTWISIIRAMLIAMLAGYLFQPWPAARGVPNRLSWVPGILYIAAALLDYLDGLVARACRHETRLGAYLDINIDALGLLIAPLVAVGYGQLPVTYLSVGAAYYVFVLGIWWRKRNLKPVFDLNPRRSARLIAGFQMGLVGVALLPLFAPPATMIAAHLFMAPLLAGFVRDWCFVCGYLKSV